MQHDGAFTGQRDKSNPPPLSTCADAKKALRLIGSKFPMVEPGKNPIRRAPFMAGKKMLAVKSADDWFERQTWDSSSGFRWLWRQTRIRNIDGEIAMRAVHGVEQRSDFFARARAEFDDLGMRPDERAISSACRSSSPARSADVIFGSAQISSNSRDPSVS